MISVSGFREKIFKNLKNAQNLIPLKIGIAI